MKNIIAFLFAVLMVSTTYAADPGETRCGADGMVEEYQCWGTNCRWQSKYQRCANTNRAPACNAGDTKCGANGYVQNCVTVMGETTWQGGFQRCAADRDPSDNAPQGYGGYNRPNPYSSGGSSGGYSGGNSAPAVCTVGQQECGDDRQIRRCVMQGGRANWQVVPGSRCGGSTGMRH